MNKLWIFGCSHATGEFNLQDPSESWPSIVATALDRTETNCAMSGSSNDDIVLSVINNLPKIESADKIIVLMTHPHRISYNDQVLKPSNSYDEWWYKVVSDDTFYGNKQLHQLLALHGLLKGVDYTIGFVDPSLLFAMTATNKQVKKYFTENCFILPKLQLTKSFPLGDDRLHLSPIGHKELAKYILDKINIYTTF